VNKEKMIGTSVLLRVSEPYELSVKCGSDYQGKILEVIGNPGEEGLIIEVHPDMEDMSGNRAKYVVVDSRYYGSDITDPLGKNPVTVNFSGLKSWPIPESEIRTPNLLGIGSGTIRGAS
jgi:hypothetical protein